MALLRWIIHWGVHFLNSLGHVQARKNVLTNRSTYFQSSSNLSGNALTQPTERQTLLARIPPRRPPPLARASACSLRRAAAGRDMVRRESVGEEGGGGGGGGGNGAEKG